ncbi:MAG: sugar ABC transporter ATP-binding protein [Oscillospiraceae bacterium]
MGKEILRAEKINKSFPGVKALSDVSFDLMEGEVHILLGENGAGKSTLMKIFSGLYSIDSGDIYIDGEKVNIRSTKDAQDLGIAIIYQEFNLVPHLTVAQNIFLGREPLLKSGNIDKAKMRREAQERLDFLNANISADTEVATLGVAQQQLVEIAKALSQNARILIMDEPTAALSESEIEMLFKTIEDLTAHGVSIIYISHRLQELKVVGDRVTVLRDGCTIGTEDLDKITMDEMVHMMVGRNVSRDRVRLKNTSTGEVALEVKNASRGKAVKNASLTVHKGEIVALSGLVGAGRTELVHAIYGIDKLDSGEVYINGEQVKKITPSNSVRRGLGLLPESRKEFGLSLLLPIFQNVTQAALKKISRFGIMSLKKERAATQSYIDRLNIVCPGMKQKVVNLSGGNQQKVVLGKWLFTESNILIFDEPTRGIDVGARDEIYHLIDDLAKAGNSILVISSDLPEILSIADRIYVMRMGEIVAEMPCEGATQETIISYASGGKQ